MSSPSAAVLGALVAKIKAYEPDLSDYIHQCVFPPKKPCPFCGYPKSVGNLNVRCCGFTAIGTDLILKPQFRLVSRNMIYTDEMPWRKPLMELRIQYPIHKEIPLQEKKKIRTPTKKKYPPRVPVHYTKNPRHCKGR